MSKGHFVKYPYEERKEIYDKALNRWGCHAQEWVFIGEVGELLDALADIKRGRCGVKHVAEEIADVTIMLEQLRVMYDCNEEVLRIIDKKVQRLAERLEKDTEQQEVPG